MVDFIRNNQNGFMTKLEDSAEILVKKTRRFLPHIARVCLTMTFIEDAYRLISQWSDQVDYIKSIWGLPSFFIWIFILYNICGQLIGSGMVIIRYNVRYGCAILVSTIIIQTIGYGITSKVFLMRNLALIGALVLLFAEANEKIKSSMAGMLDTGINQPKQYMLLFGRLMVVMIFVSLIHWSGSFIYMIQTLANLVLIIMVAVGYKTKLCSVILVVWLTCMNLFYNNFWSYFNQDFLWDFLKYDFFQTWSVIGGLMLIIAYGPGGVSVDDYKKDW